MDIGRSRHTTFSIAHLQSPILWGRRVNRPCDKKRSPQKIQKKFLTAHSGDARLSLIIASLLEVVNKQQGGEAGAMRRRKKGLEWSEAATHALTPCSRRPGLRRKKLLTRKWA
jgi:hypothetical protein